MNRLDSFILDWFSDVKTFEDLSLAQFVFAFTSFLLAVVFKGVLFPCLKKR